MKKYDKLILVVLLAVFGTGIFITARSAFDQYVTFAYAQESNRNVQVKGKPIVGTLEMLSDNEFAFDMADFEGDVYRVVNHNTIPPNLFEVDYVVAKGRVEGDVFRANRILVKCPSKYEPVIE